MARSGTGEGARRPVPLCDVLLAVLAGHPGLLAPSGYADVLDVGGGSGTLGLALAAHGHRVRVVDPSPDAIAALERRAAEQGLSARVEGIVGDVLTVPALASDVDLVCLHDVAEYLPDTEAALAALRSVLRPRGLFSLVVPQRSAAVLARALAGRPDQARIALHAPDGRWGPADPVPRRFDRGEIVAMLARAGFAVELVRGERTVSELVPGALRDVDSATRRAYRELEAELATDPVFAAVAARVHVVAVAA